MPTHLRKIMGRTPVLLVFLLSASISVWIARQAPEPTVTYLLKKDYVSQAELWKRRVISHLDAGEQTFVDRALNEEEVHFLSLVPEASDVYRFKLFDASGNIFWSTRPSDTGKVNTADYFHNIVAKGQVYVKRAIKPASEIDGLEIHTLQQDLHTEHIIYEVYTPIALKGRFVGAIEFYTDATTLTGLTTLRVQVASYTIAALFTLMITMTSWIVLRTSRVQMKAIKQRGDEERAAMEKQMQLAREVKLLGDLNEWLQSSKSLAELFDMVSRFMSHLLPNAEGSIYVYSNSRDVLDGSAAWNGGDYKAHIHPEGCWGLRRGRTYEYGRHEINFVCEHAEPHDERPYFCFPILAHGETVGLMHLRMVQGGNENAFYKDKKLAQMCAEQISMAIANVRMRDQLEEQSTRDPLTGLFNRRYMMEKLRRVLGLNGRKKELVHLLYLDVDHFKKFNDEHGHDAGDIVLRSVGDKLHEACDGDDIACRMGGEEFMLIWAGCTDQEVRERAEKLREDISKMLVPYNEKHLPSVTISGGISCFPRDSKDLQELLRQSDEALYRSKDGGRNQITPFSPPPLPSGKPKALKPIPSSKSVAAE